jgi:3-isopropylmalate dehydrogenase
MTKNIVILAGDGIGPEIMASGVAVLKVAAKKHHLDYTFDEKNFGGVAIDAQGAPLPTDTLDACKAADAILMGAIGGPKWEHAEVTPEKGLLALRKALNLFANIRPIKVMDSLAHLSPLKTEIAKGTDFVVVRELTGGIYFGEPRELRTDFALDTNVYNIHEIERIIRKGFEIARTRNKKVTSVDKANVLATSKLWRSVAETVAQDYPDCTLNHQYVDSAAMKIVQHPNDFDVIVTENLFGDVLSDEASVLPGSLGLLPSGSHSEDGPSLYEPIHGSAPDIAGQNIANPMSMIFSVSMMLRQSFNELAVADEIDAACNTVMEAGILTGDLGGTAKTTEFTKAVIAELEK